MYQLNHYNGFGRQCIAAGLNHAAAQMHVKAEFVGPDTYDPKAQHEQFQDVLKQKPTGILISASAPNLLNNDIDAAIAQGVPVIAIDSDAPASKRLLFIGTDNYKAGVMAARILAKGLAGKGNVVVFTMPEQANLKDRLRGYNDVFAEHPQLKITQVIDMQGDPRIVFDRTTEMLEKGAKVDAFACLTSIAGPEVAEVLGRKNVTGKPVVAMDTDQRTLEGIQKGLITATIGHRREAVHHGLPGSQTARRPASPSAGVADHELGSGFLLPDPNVRGHWRHPDRQEQRRKFHKSAQLRHRRQITIGRTAWTRSSRLRASG